MKPVKSGKAEDRSPDAGLIELIAQARTITETWAKRHDLWDDSCHKDPIDHYNDEPAPGGPILLLCPDSAAQTVLEWDHEPAREVRSELERVGLYLEFDDRATVCYQLIDDSSALQNRFDEHARWKWICRLVEADTADVSGDLYQHFASNPQDIHKLPPREFEKLVSSIFSARGWKTELGPGSGDEGVDLRIWQSDPLGDLLTLVQLKRYSPHNPIKLEAVAALDAHVERERANRGLFITSSRYLPVAKRFADRSKHRLQLADTSDLQQWCTESAHEMREAKNRALAARSLAEFMEEIRRSPSHPRLLVGDRFGTSFCVILRETRTSALLAHIPSEIASGDAHRGTRVPVLNGTVQDLPFGATVFRARRADHNGDITYWGQRTLYYVWDGKPRSYDYWD